MIETNLEGRGEWKRGNEYMRRQERKVRSLWISGDVERKIEGYAGYYVQKKIDDVKTVGGKWQIDGGKGMG